MTDYFVTTFARRHEHIYGHRFIESWLKHSRHKLVLFYESWISPLSPAGGQVILRDLDQDPERQWFLRNAPQDHPSDYRCQPRRFCHKVFALTSSEIPQDCERLFWIDADVIMTGNPDLDEILPEGRTLAYLQRDGVISHSECGLVGYDLRDLEVRALLSAIRGTFSSGMVHGLPHDQKHDSAVFDMHKSIVPVERHHHLSRDPKSIYPWDTSCLSKWARHEKGPARKIRAYGSL
jgi:hypothetical protein